jgi:phosphoribosylglycinamide formyltransferase 1
VKKKTSQSHTLLSNNQKSKYRLAVLASGSGSNAERFFQYFKEHPRIEVTLTISNNPQAYVLERSKTAGIPSMVIRKPEWNNEEMIRRLFRSHKIDAVVLAGYLLLIPSYLTEMFSGRIFNIHPALLPDFGGKGMYGIHVHRAVIESGVKQSGITIHLVNETYDEGMILFSDTLDILPGDTPESLASRILKLEHRHYPLVVERYLTEKPLSPKP